MRYESDAEAASEADRRDRDNDSDDEHSATYQAYMAQAGVRSTSSSRPHSASLQQQQQQQQHPDAPALGKGSAKTSPIGAKQFGFGDAAHSSAGGVQRKDELVEVPVDRRVRSSSLRAMTSASSASFNPTNPFHRPPQPKQPPQQQPPQQLRHQPSSGALQGKMPDEEGDVRDDDSVVGGEELVITVERFTKDSLGFGVRGIRDHSGQVCLWLWLWL